MSKWRTKTTRESMSKWMTINERRSKITRNDCEEEEVHEQEEDHD